MKIRACQAGAYLNFIGAFVREPVRRDQTDARSQGRLRRFGVHENDSLADAAKAIARSHTIVVRPSRRFALAIRFALGGR
jgi:hypothetical protein